MEGLAPQRSKPSVAIVGGGFGGIAAAVMLRREGYEDVTVFERGERSAASGKPTPSPASPATSPPTSTSSRSRPTRDWTRRYAPGAEIQAYIEDVARRHGVLDRVRLGTEVERAAFDEEHGRWVLETSAGSHEAEVLVTACGQLSVPTVPPIPGLDEFEGPAFHTARWREDVELAGKRVAVVGTGCSSIQVVPAIQPDGGKARRLPALTRLDDPAHGLRVSGRWRGACSGACPHSNASIGRSASPSWRQRPPA